MEARQHKREISYPCSEKQFRSIETILRGLRPIEEEFLLVELEGYSDNLKYIQALNEGVGKGYLVELVFRYPSKDATSIACKTELPVGETIKTFRSVCMKDEYDLDEWTDGYFDPASGQFNITCKTHPT